MELTLKRLLEQAEFTETRKGYDRGQVDDFLDKAVAMATKVEARLTQALDQAKGAPAAVAAGGPSAADVEAEVQRRVQAHLAELPAPAAAPPAPTAPSGPSEDETAEEVRRTLVLAQRTADAAVREAREDAAKLLAEAQERAATLSAEADAAAAQAHAGLTSEIASERQAAHARLAGEIAELEGAREALRTDVSVLERHVEEQRSQLGSTIGELQRLLDDPAGFRLAPTPVLLDPEVPAFAPSPAADPEPEAEPEAELSPVAEASVPAPPAPPAVVIDEASASSAGDLDFGDAVDHEVPGVTGLPDAGPPTAPVSAVDLGIAPPSEAAPAPSASGPVGEEDAFLAELRKAMADDEPLGPRDQGAEGAMFDDDEDRRGWRFGKRR